MQNAVVDESAASTPNTQTIGSRSAGVHTDVSFDLDAALLWPSGSATNGYLALLLLRKMKLNPLADSHDPGGEKTVAPSRNATHQLLDPSFYDDEELIDPSDEESGMSKKG